MLVHPAAILFITLLSVSVLIMVSANSWFTAWVGLEMNLLSFVPLIVAKKNKYSVESALKYFLVQAFASIFIILSTCLTADTRLYMGVLGASLLLKSGSAPTHQWMPSMAEGLSWPSLTLLMTLQKMGPIVMIFFLSKPDFLTLVLYLYVTASATIGAVGGLSQSSLRKVLVYSSIAHMSWVLATLLQDSCLWLLYFSAYALVVTSFISLLAYSQMSSLNHITTMNKSFASTVVAMTLMSLGGLPPFTGFVPKLMTVQLLAPTNLAFLLFPLLASTFVSLFFYARLLVATIITAGSSQMPVSLAPFSSSNLLAANLMGLLLPSLCFVLM
nr:TPA_asm: ND2 [Baikalogammarus pullus]